jgi:PKD repeat protein
MAVPYKGSGNNSYPYVTFAFVSTAYKPSFYWSNGTNSSYLPPVASFTATPSAGFIPLNVSLVSNSTGTISNYTWNMGDGSTAWGTTLSSTNHWYNVNGNYTVQLTVMGPYGQSNTTQNVTVGMAGSSVYSIAVSPSAGTTNTTFTGTLSPSTNVQAVRWYAIYPGQTTPADFYDATSTASSQKNLHYVLNGTTWYGWDTATGGFTNNKGTTFPNPVTLIPRYSGDIIVGCYVYTLDGLFYNPTTTLTAGAGQSLQKITFLAEDALSGSLVSPSTFNIKKLSTNTWTNGSEIRPGQIDVEHPAGTALYVQVVPPTGSGYSTGSLTYQVLDTTGYSQNKIVHLWKNSSTNVSLTTANLIVTKNSDFSPIKGASMTLSDGQSCTTNTVGACQFTLNNGSTYTSTVRATGYQTNQFYFMPTGADYSRAFMMVAIGATPTPYVTVPVVTATTIPGATTAIPTLNPARRQANVDSAADVWFTYAVGLSSLIFIAVIITIVRKMGGKK